MAQLAELQKKLDKFEKEKIQNEERLKNLLKQKKEIEKGLKAIGIDSIDDIAKEEKKLNNELEMLLKDLEEADKPIDPQDPQEEEIEADFSGDDLMHDLDDDDEAADRKKRIKDSIDPSDATDDLLSDLGLD